MTADRFAKVLSLGTALIAFGVGTTFAACPDDAAIGAMDEAIPAGEPAGPVLVESVQDGAELVNAKRAAVLGHPLSSALWLRDTGVVFKKGDLVSVGSIGPHMQPEPGLTVTVTYSGLPGDPALTLGFE